METNRSFAGADARHEDLRRLRQIQDCRIDDFRLGGISQNQSAIDQTAGINDHLRFAQQSCSLNSDQFGIARPGADEIDFIHNRSNRGFADSFQKTLTLYSLETLCARISCC